MKIQYPKNFDFYPTQCHYCGGKVNYVNNKVIYGKPFGKSPYAYLCEDCKAKVGTHSIICKRALGLLANAETTTARKTCKPYFLKLCSSLGKRKAYQHLSTLMNIPPEQCHWGIFDAPMCYKALKLLKEDIA